VPSSSKIASGALASKIQPVDFSEDMYRDVRQLYDLTFKSTNGQGVLQDLIERFDPIITPPPLNGEQAMYVAGIRAVLAHINDMNGGNYAKAMAELSKRP